MKFLFRVDASHEIGSGHLVRCLALSHRLLEQGHEVHFQTNAPIENGEITTHQKQPIGINFDWCIFDQYDLDHKDESEFRKITKKIAVIDDHGTRKHDADLIIDPSISGNTINRRNVNKGTPFYSGADYLILRSDFKEAHLIAKKRIQFKNVLVFFGGTDPKHLTIAYLTEIKSQIDKVKHLHFHFLISDNHPNLSVIKKMEKIDTITFHYSPKSVANLMLNCDLYLGSAGTISWERMCLGLTGCVVSIVENQVDLAKKLDELNLHHYLGNSDQVTPAQAIDQLLEIIKTPELLQNQSAECIKLIDALGVDRISSLFK